MTEGQTRDCFTINVRIQQKPLFNNKAKIFHYLPTVTTEKLQELELCKCDVDMEHFPPEKRCSHLSNSQTTCESDTCYLMQHCGYDWDKRDAYQLPGKCRGHNWCKPTALDHCFPAAKHKQKCNNIRVICIEPEQVSEAGDQEQAHGGAELEDQDDVGEGNEITAAQAENGG